MDVKRSSRSSNWLVVTDACLHLALVFTFVAGLTFIGASRMVESAGQLVAAALSSVYLAMFVALPTFLLPSLLVALMVHKSNNVICWGLAFIFSGIFALASIAAWLAPGCQYSKVWEPLCSAEIRESITLAPSGTWAFAVAHLFATLWLCWKSRRQRSDQRLAVATESS
ncbi:MAG: hypothetical protein EAZ21_13765 [Betaproteobacteria bacterium]|nr:MAG: hypothetical protein EAZ21_13765 [Betaproteobacteria bacterium]